jgi:predicted nucleotidyltransferase
MPSSAVAESLETTLDSAVRRIISAVHPLKIVLFGSAARDQLNPHSDLDLLVVVPPGTHRRKTAQKIYRHLIGVDFPVDVVVVTEEDIAQFKGHSGMVIRPALEEGQVLYAA